MRTWNARWIHALAGAGLMWLATVGAAQAAAVMGGPPTELLVPMELPLPAGSLRPTTAPARDWYLQGQAHLAAGRIDEARQAFEALARQQPPLYVAALGLAEVALRSGDVAEARKQMARAVDIAPKAAEVQAAAGRLAYGLGRRDEAVAHFERAILLDDRFVTPRLDLAEAQLAAGRVDQAVQTFGAAAALDSRHAGAQFGLGRALAAQGQWAKAAQAFERSAAAAPGVPMPLIALAQVQARRGDLTGALAALTRAEPLDPASPQPALVRAELLAAAGRTADAERAYLDALQRHSGAAAAALQLQLGALYQRTGRPDRARDSYLAALRTEPRMHQAYNNLAWLAAERRTELDQALGWVREALKLAPRAASYHDTLGFVHEARGEVRDAVAAFQAAADADRSQPLFAYHLGRALQADGRTGQAVAALDRALMLAKGSETFVADARRRRATLSAPPAASSSALPR